MSSRPFIDYLIIGNAASEYVIDLNGKAHNGFPGGPLLYTAGGLRCWKNRLGLFGEVHVARNAEVVSLLNQYDIDSTGIRISGRDFDDRVFFGYLTPDEIVTENPVAFYASKQLTFPRSLVGYSNGNKNVMESGKFNRSQYLLEDFPPYYLETSAIHICAANLKTQIQLSSLLHHNSKKILTLQSENSYMNVLNWNSLPVLMKDLTAFITTKPQLYALFKNRSHDIWDMMEYLCELGCASIVVDDGTDGQLLFDRQTKIRYEVPAYPASLVDPTGMKESFCGGFLAGIKMNYDPLEAVLYGNVSASLTGEGTGPFYATDTFPGLIQNRLSFIKELATRI